jgi:hypothetical protein
MARRCLDAATGAGWLALGIDSKFYDDKSLHYHSRVDTMGTSGPKVPDPCFVAAWPGVSAIHVLEL